MDDFDDVFDDLDDAALAELDKIESNNASISQESDPRPLKRQKVVHQPILEPVNDGDAESFDLEDLPEVSVQNNNYSIDMDTIMQEAPRRIQEAPMNNRIQPSQNLNSRKRPAPGSFAAQRNQTLGHGVPSNGSRRNSVPANRRAGSGARLSAIAAALSVPAPAPTPPAAPAPTPPAPPAPTQRPRHFEALTGRVDELQKQLEQLREENERMQNALKEAQDARFAKEGEVTVLRKNIERAAHDHAAQMAKLRSSKEESDSKHLAAQKEMKEEMERLRTQIVFKQHEAETAAMKRGSPSVRGRGPQREMTQTIPVPPKTPTRKSAFKQPPANLPDGFMVASPSRKMTSVANRYPISPEKSRKSAILPGFENSFLGSPSKPKPNRSSQPSRAPATSQRVIPSQSSQRPVSTLQYVPLSQTSYAPQLQVDDDAIMDDLPGPASPTPADAIMDQDAAENAAEHEGPAESEDEDDDYPEIMQLNRRAELNRAILTHIHPTSKLPLLQSLMDWASTPDFPSTQVFAESMAMILETVASISDDLVLDITVSILTRCLVSIFEAFMATNLLPPLSAIANLLSVLMLTHPEFRLSLLTHNVHDTDKRPKILILLSRLIQDQLSPENHNAQSQTLSEEVFNLLEALVWDIPVELVEELAIIPCNQALTTVLFHNAQPHWFLSRSTRFIALLFSYPTIYQHCVNLATTELEKDVDLGQIFHLDRLCSFLIDTGRCDPDAVCMKTHILMLFAAFSMAPPDGLNLLVNSQVLVSSIVTYIAYLTQPIWDEEDEDSWDHHLKPPALTTHTLSRAVALLHYIVNNCQPPISLRQKFHKSPVRAFNGITHNYIITFGRLAYAPPPEWLNEDSKQHLAGVVEMARDLLEMVVDGPEVDSIWALYQDDLENDEGDMEERLMAD